MPETTDDEPDVTVLGGGISGITTALTLELLGYRTELRTAERADDPQSRSPAFATLWGAGAIYPYKITVEGLEEVVADSMAIFGLLVDSGAYGLRRQRHYWLFENESADLPATVEAEPVADPPALPGRTVAGYASTMLFAEMQTYLPRLYETYEAAGGTVHRHRVTREELDALPGEVLVNCTGYYSRELFDDDRPFVAARGHLVRAEAPLPTRDGQLTSYFYETAPDGDPLYCFPRTDALFLGGTSQEGEPDPDGPWEGETHDGPTVTLGGTRVPERLLTDNAALLEQFGVDVGAAPKRGLVGYRPVRDPDGDGVRVELADEDGVRVVHNYGHGGAGIALSWGCALRVARLLAGCDCLDSHDVETRTWTGPRAVMNHVRETLERRR